MIAIHVANGERVEILPREDVECMARIMGGLSAAAQALACVDSGQHGTDALIARPLKHRQTLIVTPATHLLPIGEP